ncbi:glycosyltransferase [Aureimonas populi]|uniref:Glycosyltransferase n=1 Tax=Aureimonas populi TaxID=1701758 RepID=A0ABW5CQA3_9HYPH|nr:glycosyltransferase [Aureimonas populi]
MRGVWRIQQWFAERAHKRRLREAIDAVSRFPTLAERKPHTLDAPLIVTLTSYPLRFPTLGSTIRSLLDQTIRPDRTILWIAEGDLAELPPEVLSLKAFGLEIRTCADLRSYKKLIPALHAFGPSYFVTADDDVYYPPHWLEGLVSQVYAHGPHVVAGRAHLLRLDASGRALPYLEWDLQTSHIRAPSDETRIFPTGVGGVLYPPNGFADAVLDEAAFMRLCPQGDDIWFFWMARLAGTPQIQAEARFHILSWPQSQSVALFHENVYKDQNNIQIRSMEEAYGLVP